MDMRQAERNLRRLGSDPGALEIVEGLADVWVAKAQSVAPVDTGQLRARIVVSRLSGSGVKGEATVESDVPYAGFQEFGTRYQPAQPYFRPGRDAAKQAAERMGGRLSTQLRRGTVSGGVWNPRAAL